MAKRTHQTTPACVLNSRRPTAPSSQAPMTVCPVMSAACSTSHANPEGTIAMADRVAALNNHRRAEGSATAGRRPRMQTNSRAPMAWIATAK